MNTDPQLTAAISGCDALLATLDDLRADCARVVMACEAVADTQRPLLRLMDGQVDVLVTLLRYEVLCLDRKGDRR